MGYVGNNGTLDTNYHLSIADRQAAQGSGAFRNGATPRQAQLYRKQADRRRLADRAQMLIDADVVQIATARGAAKKK